MEVLVEPALKLRQIGVTLRLLELVRTPGAPELELSRPGKEWGMLVARQEVRAMRRAFRSRRHADFTRELERLG